MTANVRERRIAREVRRRACVRVSDRDCDFELRTALYAKELLHGITHNRPRPQGKAGFDEKMFGATLNDAAYIMGSTGTAQKVLTCTYDPLPRLVSPETVHEMFPDVRKLTPEYRKILEDKFGSD